MKYIRLRVKKIDMVVGEKMKILLNEKTAFRLGLMAGNSVELSYKKDDKREKIIVMVNLTKIIVFDGEVGITKDFGEEYGIRWWDVVKIRVIEKDPISLSAIKHKLLGKRLSEQEIKELMRDLTDGKMSDLLTAYYTACSFCRPADDRELYLTAKYSAEMGDMIRFRKDTAVKYCIGGVPGNETTMIIIPILGSLGIDCPKTFSRAITSPAATGECVEILMDTEFSVPEMKKLVRKTGSCLARGRCLKLAPANDKIINVSYPLYMEAYGKVAVSIMAKIYAGGAKYCLIDIPYGKSGKITHLKNAKKVGGHFDYIGRHLGMKMGIVYSNADAPVGKGIGAVFQCREALRILQNKDNYSKDIRDKAIKLSAKLIELVGLAKGPRAKKMAEKQLVSGEAWEYMKKLIVAQNAVHKKQPDMKNISFLGILDSEDIPMADYKATYMSDFSGVVKSIDVENLKLFCRHLGAPLDKQAGFYLLKQVGDKVKKGEALCEFYANDRESLNHVIKMLGEKNFYVIG